MKWKDGAIIHFFKNQPVNPLSIHTFSVRFQIYTSNKKYNAFLLISCEYFKSGNVQTTKYSVFFYHILSFRQNVKYLNFKYYP